MRPHLIEHCLFMVVDENRHMRHIVKNILHSNGCKKIIEADDGADALKLMRATVPDMIITEWNMSPLDGLDLVKLLRNGKDSPNPLVPILMLTASTEIHHVIMARDAGVNGIVVKPVAADVLIHRVLHALEKPGPFIRSHEYFGPDRRHNIHGGPHNGRDRRAQRAPLIPVVSVFERLDDKGMGYNQRPMSFSA